MKYAITLIVLVILAYFFIPKSSSTPSFEDNINLANAFNSRDVKQLKKVIEDGYPKDFINPVDGNSLLHMSVNICDIEYVKYVLSLNLDPNIKNNESKKAIDIAKERSKSTITYSDGRTKEVDSPYADIYRALKQYQSTYKK